MQKIVILPSCNLQFVRKPKKWNKARCGKPGGKCGIPHPKWALKQDFWTFSTGFSTCGKNQGLLHCVYWWNVENFFARQNGRIFCPAGGKTWRDRQNNSAKAENRRRAGRRWRFRWKNWNSIANKGGLCYTSRWVIIPQARFELACTLRWKNIMIIKNIFFSND